MAWFVIQKSICGNYWQVRVRNDIGEEDTVDRVYSIEEAYEKYDILKGKGLIPLLEKSEIKLIHGKEMKKC